MYDLSINGLNVLSININTRGICVLYELSANVLNSKSVHVYSRYFGDSEEVTSESGLHGLNVLNGLRLESALNVLNGLNLLNGLGTESAHEHSKLKNVAELIERIGTLDTLRYVCNVVWISLVTFHDIYTCD